MSPLVTSSRHALRDGLFIETSVNLITQSQRGRPALRNPTLPPPTSPINIDGSQACSPEPMFFPMSPVFADEEIHKMSPPSRGYNIGPINPQPKPIRRGRPSFDASPATQGFMYTVPRLNGFHPRTPHPINPLVARQPMDNSQNDLEFAHLFHHSTPRQHQPLDDSPPSSSHSSFTMPIPIPGRQSPRSYHPSAESSPSVLTPSDRFTTSRAHEKFDYDSSDMEPESYEQSGPRPGKKFW